MPYSFEPGGDATRRATSSCSITCTSARGRAARGSGAAAGSRRSRAGCRRGGCRGGTSAREVRRAARRRSRSSTFAGARARSRAASAASSSTATTRARARGERQRERAGAGSDLEERLVRPRRDRRAAAARPKRARGSAVRGGAASSGERNARRRVSLERSAHAPRRALHVAFVASEMVPFIKTGGLADVAAALPKALGSSATGSPSSCRATGRSRFRPGEFAGSVHVPVDEVHRSAGFYRRALRPGRRGRVRRAPAVLRPARALRRRQPRLRGQPRCASRSSRARAIEYFRSRGERPRRVPRARLADRAGARLPEVVLLGRPDAAPHRRRVFTIHNLAYQGNFAADTLGRAGPALEPGPATRSSTTAGSAT